MSARDQYLAKSLSGAQTGLRRGAVSSVLFRPRTLIALLLVGLFSFAALIVLSGFADDFRKAPPGQATPRSVSAVGYKALFDMMDDLGYDVRETRGGREYWERERRLILYTPANPYTRLNSILKDVGSNETQLIVLPKWSVAQMFPEPGEEAKTGWARRSRGDGLIGAGTYDFILDTVPVIRRDETPSPRADIAYTQALDRGLDDNPTLDFEQLQYFDLATRWPDYDKELRALQRAMREALRRERRGEDSEETDAPETSDGDKDDTDEETEADDAEAEAELKPLPNHEILMRVDGNPVLIRLEDTQTYILSEPDLINTSALDTQTGAEIALSIFNEVTSHAELDDYTVDFDLRLHGLESGRNIIKLMLSPPFLAATLCLLAAGGLIAWQGFNRFGDPERVRPDYTQGPVSLAKTAANFMEIAGRTHRTGGDYAALIRRQVVSHLGYAGRTEDKTNTLLDAREKRLDISPRFDELSRAIQNADAASYGQYAQALADWRDRMITNRFQREDTS